MQWMDDDGEVMCSEYLVDFANRILGLPHTMWQIVERLHPPAAPAEAVEPEDALVTDGLALGSAGAGRAVLPAQPSTGSGRGGAQRYASSGRDIVGSR